MKVQIFVGIGAQRQLVWSGTLKHLPRVTEDVVVRKKSNTIAGRVERIHHFVADGIVDVYIR